MKNGRIIKLIGGLYTVVDNDNNQYVLRPRGKFRHLNTSPKVGDYALFNEDVIMDILERNNDLVRPQIANVDQAILVNSAKHPNFSFNLLDRFLTIIENEDIHPIIVITKIDLLEAKELAELKEKMTYYETFYNVYYVDGLHALNTDSIKHIFKDKVSVLSGQTGAGKSTLLNALKPELNLKTDAISMALGRGKHTTRHVELIPFNDGWVADTPGFSKLDFRNVNLDNVPLNFVDFFEISHNCKFNGCTHLNEPGCEVKRLLNEGKILLSRYENYKKIYEEIEQEKPKY